MSKTVYSYEEARGEIKDGDIVFIKNRKRFFSRIIQFFTRSDYSHVGIAFWVKVNSDSERLMMVEAQGGARRRIVNISYHFNSELDIIAPPKEWGYVYNIALAKLSEVPYGYVEALYVGLREFLMKYLNIKLPRKNLPGEICSEFIGNVYDLEKRHVSPQILFEHLTEDLKLPYRIRVRKQN